MRLLSHLLLTFCLAIASFHLAAAQQQVSEAQLKKLNREISAVTKRLSRNQSKVSKLEASLRNSEQSIGKITQHIDVLDQHLGSMVNNAETLQKRYRRLQKGLETRRKVIELQIIQQLKLGSQPRLELLLNLQNPDQVSRQLRYFDKIHQALGTQLTEYRQMIEELDNTHVAIGQNSMSMIEQRKILKAEYQKLEQAQKKRKDTLVALRKRIGKDKEKLTRLKRDQQQMEKLVAELRQVLDLTKLASNDKSFRALKGKLPWPIKGKLIRSFGNKQAGVPFDGIWIAAKTGQPVKTIHSGRVVFSDWLRGYGMVTIIDHGNNYMSLYGYNQSLLRAPGDWVAAGDPIATIGNSGGHSRSGLYFAIRYNSKSTNPRRWLAKP